MQELLSFPRMTENRSRQTTAAVLIILHIFPRWESLASTWNKPTDAIVVQWTHEPNSWLFDRREKDPWVIVNKQTSACSKCVYACSTMYSIAVGAPQFSSAHAIYPPLFAVQNMRLQ